MALDSLSQFKVDTTVATFVELKEGRASRQQKA